MIDITGFVFAYHVIKALQSLLLDKVSDFIRYLKVNAYLLRFDVIPARNLVLRLSFIIYYYDK